MRTFSAILLTCLLGSSAWATPVQLGHQGRLLDVSGNAVEGDRELVFQLYGQATGGSPVWTETQTASLADGVYSASLGSVQSLDDGLFDQDLWLSVAVVGTAFDAPASTYTPFPLPCEPTAWWER